MGEISKEQVQKEINLGALRNKLSAFEVKHGLRIIKIAKDGRFQIEDGFANKSDLVCAASELFMKALSKILWTETGKDGKEHLVLPEGYEEWDPEGEEPVMVEQVHRSANTPGSGTDLK